MNAAAKASWRRLGWGASDCGGAQSTADFVAPLLDQQTATIIADGRPLSDQFCGPVCQHHGRSAASGRAVSIRLSTRTLSLLAYAVSAREMAALVPLLMSGKVPLDLGLCAVRLRR